MNKELSDYDKNFNSIYTLKNGKMEACITNYGASLIAIRVPNREGNLTDILLGYDTIEEYRDGDCYFGGLVGRCANRIADGRATIAGVTYELSRNEGTNHHHSAEFCTAMKNWEVDEECSDERHLYLTCCDKEAKGGFPGTIHFAACYELTPDDCLILSVKGISDKTTVMNLTSHGYFQLDGHDAGDISKQKLQIFAKEYTPLASEHGIPNGEIRNVADTVFDFRKARTLGDGLCKEDEQLLIAKGYDHNFILDGDKDEEGLRLAAIAQGDVSGIRMRMYTNCPCMQLYTGNYITPTKGKNGAIYGPRSGFCLEPQYTPNAINMNGVDKPIIPAQKLYEFKLVLQFDTVK